MKFSNKSIFFSSLFKSSTIYTFFGFINSSVPFLLLPILTRKLSPQDFGIVSMFQIAFAFLIPFISLNLDGAISRAYYEYDKSEFPAYIGNCILVVVASLCIIFPLMFVFQSSFGKLFSLSPSLLYMVILVSFFQSIISILLVVFQVTIQPYKYGLFQFFQTIFNFSLTIILIFSFSMTWEGRINAQIISTFFISIIALFYLIKFYGIRFKYNRNYVVNSLKFGLPLIPHAIGGVVFTTIDRVFLTNFFGLEQTGNYSVAYQLGAVISLITLSINNAYVPWLYAKLSENRQEIKFKIVKFTYIYFCILIFLAILFLFFFPIIVNYMIDDTYKTINSYSIFIVFGFVFQGMYFMVTNYITYAKKTYIQALITFSVALVKIPITYFSILILGASGASLSFCLTFFIFFISTWIVSNRIFPMPWIVFNK